MYEDILIERVRRGEFRIDKQGRIWRCGIRGFECPKCGACTERRIDGQLRSGYRALWLQHKKRGIAIKAHRAVWTYFNGPIPQNMEINHKNGIKSDNRPENLELVTHLENMRHSIEVLGNDPARRGEKNPGAKLTEKDVTNIDKLLDDGIAQREVADMFGVSATTVSYIGGRKTWKCATLRERNKSIKEEKRGG